MVSILISQIIGQMRGTSHESQTSWVRWCRNTSRERVYQIFLIITCRERRNHILKTHITITCRERINHLLHTCKTPREGKKEPCATCMQSNNSRKDPTHGQRMDHIPPICQPSIVGNEHLTCGEKDEPCPTNMSTTRCLNASLIGVPTGEGEPLILLICRRGRWTTHPMHISSYVGEGEPLTLHTCFKCRGRWTTYPTHMSVVTGKGEPLTLYTMHL